MTAFEQRSEGSWRELRFGLRPCCPGCGKPVDRRRQSHTFEAPRVWHLACYLKNYRPETTW